MKSQHTQSLPPILRFSSYRAGALAVALAFSTSCAGAIHTSPSTPSQPAANVRSREAQPITRAAADTGGSKVIRGEEGDWRTDAPGVRRLITPQDLPLPYATRSFDNGPHLVPRPPDAWPRVPTGFKVTEFVTGLDEPRKIITAPNGDLFLVESRRGRVRLLRDSRGSGKPDLNTIFAEGLVQPFGLAFYPPGPNPRYLYIGATNSVVRFPYHNGDTHAAGQEEVVVPDIPSGGHLRGGGHWTRDVVFSRDGSKMYVSVGSFSNDWEGERTNETRRADVLQYNPDGSGFRIYAWGIRNAVGLAVHPQTGELWGSVNERDELGDNLVPDYVTRIREGGFYGWPWYYIGSHQDPRHPGERPDLRDKVTIPDVLLQSHIASLAMTFYTGQQFPQEYLNDGFAAEHGSWNRSRRVGYSLIRIPLHNGRPTGEYEDFMTGFVAPDGNVWGRPVGVTIARDGSLMVTDDGSGTVWRITYNRSGR